MWSDGSYIDEEFTRLGREDALIPISGEQGTKEARDCDCSD